MRYSHRFSVGLTGGIGVGKTTVTNHFACLGAGIIDADEISRAVTAPGKPAVASIARLFGRQILAGEQSLDRAKLRQLVFAEPKKKHQLEQLLHPLIRQAMHQQAAKDRSNYLIFSIPLLIETRQTHNFDRILIIDCDNALRIERVRKRSDLSSPQIEAIIRSQANSAQRLKVADDMILNNGSLERLHRSIEALHRKYLALAADHPCN